MGSKEGRTPYHSDYPMNGSPPTNRHDRYDIIDMRDQIRSSSNYMDGITKPMACFQDGITKPMACFQDGITKPVACFLDGITKPEACSQGSQ